MIDSRDAFNRSLQAGRNGLANQSWQDALTAFQEAHRTDPTSAEPLFGIGNLLRALHRNDEAIELYEQAIARDQQHFGAHNNLADLLREKERWRAAETHYRAAMATAPHVPEIANNLAGLLLEIGEFDEALQLSNHAIQIRPSYAKAYFNRGIAHHRLRQLQEAQADYALAIDHGLKTPEILTNLGALATESGDPSRAISHLTEALGMDPGHVEAEWNLAFAHLKMGQFSEGWRLYESRWRWKHFTSPPPIKGIPHWHGDEPLGGRSILILNEQGLGDFIQFSRYLPLVRDLGPTKILLEVPTGLQSLVAHNYPYVCLVDRQSALDQDPDFQIPLLSLPYAFNTEIQTIPAQHPALSAPARTGSLDCVSADRQKIGLVWAGGSRTGHHELERINQRRNLPFSLLAPIQDIDATFVSLQKGEPAESSIIENLKTHWARPNFLNCSPVIKDFSDTAALITQLDLIISVDTSTAHLAAAMGKPVWLLNRFVGCWRWLDGEDTSPWYPSMRIFSQPREGDWVSVIGAVRNALQNREW